MLKEYPVNFLNLHNGETLAYREAGTTGKTLLLIHGNMSSSIHFDTVMERLENEYKIYAVDMRGFGDSTYNQPIDSLYDFALDIKDFVEQLKLTDLTVLGWSTGGGVALELAVLLPDVVKKVILLESVGVKGYPIFKKDANGQPILTERLSTREEIAQDPIQVLPPLNAFKNNDREFFRTIYNFSIYNLKQPEPERYERYLDGIMKQRNLIDVDYALVHFNMTNDSNGVCEGTNRIKDVKADVLIIQGEKDLVVPKMFGLEIKQYLGDRAELALFDHVGHSPLTDDFETVIKKITEFMNK